MSFTLMSLNMSQCVGFRFSLSRWVGYNIIIAVLFQGELFSFKFLFLLDDEINTSLGVFLFPLYFFVP